MTKISSYMPLKHFRKFRKGLLIRLYIYILFIANRNKQWRNGHQLATYHEKLPTTIGYNTISLATATKAWIYLDNDGIVNNYFPNNAILQLAPQTVIQLGHDASAGQILRAVILDNGNINHQNIKINAVWTSSSK